MILRKKVNKDNVFINYINILNGVLHLSKREIEVFSLILNYQSIFPSTVLIREKGSFNFSTFRKTITSALGISEANLSRYLGTLKKNNLLIKRGKGWVINDTIKPDFIYVDEKGEDLENPIVEVTFALEVLDNDDKEDKSIEDYNKVQDEGAGQDN